MKKQDMPQLPLIGSHARKRMYKHNISAREVMKTWLYGEIIPSYFKRPRLVGKKLTVVLNKNEDYIITIFPNSRRNQAVGILAEGREKRKELRPGLKGGDTNAGN